MSIISSNELKPGKTIQMDQQLWVVVEYQHVKPGKGGAFVRTKLRRLSDGNVVERTFRVGEKFEEAYIEQRKLQYLYRAADTFHFMDMASYEEMALGQEIVGKSGGFLKENMECTGEFHDGKLLGLGLPIFVDYTITSTEPGIQGDTSKAGMKPALLETGATVRVPLFVDSGEKVRVDTRTGEYVSRA
jgi:elongation factor P